MKLSRALAVIAILVFAGIAIYHTQKKTPQKGEFKSADELMQFMAGEAVKKAEKENQTKLDYSVQSIEKVETILSKLHEQYVKDKDSIAVNDLSMAYGAYIGEVIKRSEPGVRWGIDHPVAGDKSYPLYWKGGESFPWGWCFKRIMNGPEDNVWHKYLLVKQQRS